MTAINKVGLEAEFFLRDKNGKELVFPENHGFETDEFIILGEFRAKPGVTRSETAANFFRAWYDVIELAKKKEKTIDISTGYTLITPEFYTEIMRKMGTKTIAHCKNIYPDVDLLKLTDAVVKDGKIEGHKLSTGLHIHLSSSDTVEKIYKKKVETYSPVKIPLSLGDVSVAEMSFYQKTGESDVEDKFSVTANRITRPVLYSIIKEFDEKILPMYKIDKILKYRNPGFYEMKVHGGFEYRSLPFNEKTFGGIFDIVDFAFNKLEELEIE